MNDPDPSPLAVVTRYVPPYRRPFYDLLAASPQVSSLTVIHGGPAVRPDAWRETVLEPRHLYDPLGRALARELDGHPDLRLVQAFDLKWAGWLFRILHQRPDVVLWGHGMGQHRWTHPLRRYLARRAGALLVYYPAGSLPFRSASLPPERIIANFNTQHVELAADTSAHPKDSLLFVGRLEPRKRLPDLLHAYARLAAHHRRAYRLVFVGDGPERLALLELVRSLDLSERVTFAGACHDEAALAAHFRRAIAYVCPGALGLGVLHAFSYGVPVISPRDLHHGPEAENLVDADNGLLYDHGPHHLLPTLQHLLDDPEWARYLGRRAFDQARRRPLDLMVSQTLRAVEIASRPRGLTR